MSEIFLKIINMSISASYIVLAVLLLRLLLKKAPKWITVVLWGIVAVRLVCPFSIESALSLIPSAETISPQVLIENPEINTGFPVLNNTINPIIQGATVTVAPEKSINALQLFVLVFSKIWIIGLAAMLIYTAISYLNLKRKIRTAVLLRDNIYQSENVVSPFVLGIIKPKIYLPFGMNEKDMEHVVAHEMAHIRRKDHLSKPLGFLLLTLHWFNPLLWLGYVLLCRDIELACDEKVIKELDHDARADYSEALLTCSVNRRMIAACPLAFGEVGVKDRVKSVLNYKKPAFWIIIAAVVACVAVAVCFLTDPTNNYYKGPLSCTRYDDEKEGFNVVCIIDFTEDAIDDIVSVLNESKWEEGALDHAYDFEFVLDNATIVYQSVSGILVDKTNERHSNLDLPTQVKLNRIIGADVFKVLPIYASPIYSSTMSPREVPEIEIENGVIYTVSEGVKERLGTVKKKTITYFNFDSFIKKYDGFDHSELARELRMTNKIAYEVTPDASIDGVGVYYIMEQKNGEMLIVYGHYDEGIKENEIRYIFSIDP
jgi:beta-lactamase regulating signal transducer with metallopeptidase domain